MPSWLLCASICGVLRILKSAFRAISESVSSMFECTHTHTQMPPSNSIDAKWTNYIFLFCGLYLACAPVRHLLWRRFGVHFLRIFQELFTLFSSPGMRVCVCVCARKEAPKGLPYEHNNSNNMILPFLWLQSFIHIHSRRPNGNANEKQEDEMWNKYTHKDGKIINILI